MKNNRRIEWIFFDVGGVLTDDVAVETWRINALTSVAQQYNPAVTRKKVEAAHQRASKILGPINRNVFTILIKDKKQAEQALKVYYSRHRKEVDYVGSSPLRPEVLAVVKKLAKNYSLGLIANQPKEMKEKLKRANLVKYFSHLGVSKEYGMSKPDAKLFLTILKETNADPLKSVFIDDNPERGLIPAKKLGFTTIWYKHSYWGQRPFLTTSVDYTITNLNELFQILSSKKRT